MVNSNRGRARGLRGDEKVALAQLALPTFALALSITLVSSYLGEVTRHFTQQTVVIGVIIGSEGVMALWVPLLAGAWSDRARSRIGGRLPFVIGGGLPAAVALGVLGFLHSLVSVAVVTAVFFAFYFVAYEPYRAMYPDMVQGEEVAGRAQSTQAVARGCGTGAALLGGGLLLSIARQLPFVVFAALLVAALAAFVWLIVRRGVPDQRGGHAGERARDLFPRLGRLLKQHPALRAYLLANALWEMALAALKAFVILYLTLGLGYQLSTSALLIGGVAVVILVGAAAAGKLGDRFGRLRVVTIAAAVYGIGFLVPIFTTSRALLGAAMPFIALGGGAVMTMAYAVLMPLMPKDEHGLLTGFYSVSRGLGIVAGPILAGLAISLTKDGPFAATHGFQAVWIVCAAASLTSLLFLRQLRLQREDRRALRRRSDVASQEPSGV
jgi:MFS family permease